jgi:putative membrane protein
MHAGEINMAKLAKQKSANDEVKKYADEVINIHSSALKELSQTAKGSLDTQLHIEYLSLLKGADFDREFIALMIADHKDAKETFEDQLDNAENARLKKYLENTLERLGDGMDRAKDIQGDLGRVSN